MSEEKNMILAVVRPYLLDRIVAALEETDGFPGMTVWDSSGFSSPRLDEDRAIDPFRVNKTLMIVADATVSSEIAETVKREASTGKNGDGIVTVFEATSSFLI